MNTTKLFTLTLLACISASAGAAEMAKISGGNYRPLYLKRDTPMIGVKPFQLDKLPVTNREFAEFTAKNPQWQRGKISSKQAESSYLRHWAKSGNTYAPNAADLNKPVTNVSWFAANA